jgi:hypothetical protein
MPLETIHGEEETRRQNQLVVSALASIGLNCGSIYDLVNTAKSYSKAIPLLVNLLEIVTDQRILEGIIRALRVKEARNRAERSLADLFKKLGFSDRDEHIKWVIGNTLAGLNVQLVAGDLIEIAGDTRHGMARQMIVEALPRIKDEKIAELLPRFLDDESVIVHAISAVRRAKLSSAIPKLNQIAKIHSNASIRRKAKDAAEALTSQSESKGN